MTTESFATPATHARNGWGLRAMLTAFTVTALAATASIRCPSLRAKHVTPHVLRHTAAMALLAAGVDPVVIALWLGHERLETTDIYIHADISIKERALARTTPPNTPPGRYRATDPLLTFLERL